jgi:hypothetical protein
MKLNKKAIRKWVDCLRSGEIESRPYRLRVIENCGCIIAVVNYSNYNGVNPIGRYYSIARYFTGLSFDELFEIEETYMPEGGHRGREAASFSEMADLIEQAYLVPEGEF